jgi:hypothetical protein
MMKVTTFRDALSNFDPTSFSDDFGGFVFGLALWLIVLAAAPLIVLFLAGVLFSVELPVLLLIAAVLVVARFAGFVPWTVVVIDELTRGEQREQTRSFLRAVSRIREINDERRVYVHWMWT